MNVVSLNIYLLPNVSVGDFEQGVGLCFREMGSWLLRRPLTFRAHYHDPNHRALTNLMK